jgi:hypothetical protein
MKEKANTGDESAKRWIERISSLGEYLKVKIE